MLSRRHEPVEPRPGTDHGAKLPCQGEPAGTTPPYRAVVVHIAATPVIVAAAIQEEQELVFFSAGAVFVSFLAGLVAMAPWQSASTKRP